jgi:hypothetical protein
MFVSFPFAFITLMQLMLFWEIVSRTAGVLVVILFWIFVLNQACFLVLNSPKFMPRMQGNSQDNIYPNLSKEKLNPLKE